MITATSWALQLPRPLSRSEFYLRRAERLASAHNAGTDCSVPVLQSKTKSWGNSYSYDAWGNLLQKTVTKCSIGGQDVGLKGKGGSTVSSTQSDKEGNIYFQVSQHGESAMKSLTIGLVSDGTIDNPLNLAVTPDGKVGIDPGSTARDFPSLEVYSYTMDEKGNVTSTLIVDKREASPNDKNGDLGHPEKTIKDQVPK